MRLSPRSEALAYRIWAYANPLGWDCTSGGVADAIGVSMQAVGHIVRLKKWHGRFRATEQDRHGVRFAEYGTFDGVHSAAQNAIRELHIERASE